RGGNGFYRVIFKGDVTNKAILSQVTQKHRIHFNIVYGSIRELQERLFGDLIVSFEGDTVAIQSAINELETIVDIQEVAKHEG
ncbi:MAG: NIL domain-containing protein, partial [Psychrobacillus sp.]